MKKQESINWLSWLFLLLNLSSAFLISKVDDYSFWFLTLLSFNMVLGLVFAKRINNTVLFISRILVGFLFVYSGFVKGVDPLGTQFRIEDYFYAYGSVWAVPMALGLSVFMNASEFSLGALFLTKIKNNWVSTLALLMMIFFTITTINDAVNNPVPDCGCFGDFIILTNWETFYKNLVIDFFLVFVFITRNTFETPYKKTTEWSIAILTIAIFTLFNSYNINRLPIIDFRDWKVGKNLVLETTQDLKYYLTLKSWVGL